jgi:hypothetical protein
VVHCGFVDCSLRAPTGLLPRPPVIPSVPWPVICS